MSNKTYDILKWVASLVLPGTCDPCNRPCGNMEPAIRRGDRRYYHGSRRILRNCSWD